MGNQKNKARLYELDLLRFIAAISVLFYHYTFMGFAENHIQGDYTSPVEYSILAPFTQYSYLGVNLFFMISGFVILLSAKNSTALKFASSRFIRLYPAFWVAVTLSAVVIFLFGSPNYSINLPQYIMNLSMVSGYVGIDPVDGVYWTLLIELVFYALIFTVLLFKKLDYIEFLMAIWLTIITVSLFFTLPKIGRFLFFPEWGTYFISGSLLYLIYLKGLDMTRSLLLVAAYILTLYFAVLEAQELERFYILSFSKIIPLVVISLFYLIFLLIAFNKTHRIRSRKLQTVGALTYPLYLIHATIGFIIFNHFGNTVNRYFLLLAVILLMVIMAWGIHKLAEKPLAQYLQPKLRKLLRL
jgi:peptidoglycan/LPS O-acetylase OafA/YrhL